MVLPNEIVLLLEFGIGLLVTNGLKSLFPNVDISGSSAKVTAALVMICVTLSNQLLAFVPAQFQPVASTLFGLIVAILGAYGLHYTLKSRNSG